MRATARVTAPARVKGPPPACQAVPPIPAQLPTAAAAAPEEQALLRRGRREPCCRRAACWPERLAEHMASAAVEAPRLAHSVLAQGATVSEQPHQEPAQRPHEPAATTTTTASTTSTTAAAAKDPSSRGAGDGARAQGPLHHALSRELDDDVAAAFSCHICLELAHQPVVTLCGHLFCWPCLYRCAPGQLDFPHPSIPAAAHGTAPQQQQRLAWRRVLLSAPPHPRGEGATTAHAVAHVVPAAACPRAALCFFVSCTGCMTQLRLVTRDHWLVGRRTACRPQVGPGAERVPAVPRVQGGRGH